MAKSGIKILEQSVADDLFPTHPAVWIDYFGDLRPNEPQFQVLVSMYSMLIKLGVELRTIEVAMLCGQLDKLFEHCFNQWERPYPYYEKYKQNKPDMAKVSLLHSAAQDFEKYKHKLKTFNEEQEVTLDGVEYWHNPEAIKDYIEYRKDFQQRLRKLKLNKYGTFEKDLSVYE